MSGERDVTEGVLSELCNGHKRLHLAHAARPLLVLHKLTYPDLPTILEVGYYRSTVSVDFQNPENSNQKRIYNHCLAANPISEIS